jgi:hypothetical protein
MKYKLSQHFTKAASKQIWLCFDNLLKICLKTSRLSLVLTTHQLHPNGTEKQNYVEQRTVTSASLLLAWRCMLNTYGLKIQKVEVDKGKAMPLRRERVEIFFCSFAFF